jgi:hypothetical protein
MDETVRKFHSIESFEALARERVKPMPGHFDGYSEHAERMSCVRFVPVSPVNDYALWCENQRRVERLDLDLAGATR